MKIHTVPFVFISDLFKDLHDLKEAFDSFDHNNFTWGDCSHSLINKSRIFDGWEKTQEALTAGQLFVFEQRINSLPDGVLIDLES